MNQQVNPLYLYVLMRQDMNSLVHEPGKAIAQGTHAVSQFHEKMHSLEKSGSLTGMNENSEQNRIWISQFYAWKHETGSFGTVITLEVDERDLRVLILGAVSQGFFTELCEDPTYPIRDGYVTHLIPLVTCGYIFGGREDLRPLLGECSLMKRNESAILTYKDKSS